MCSCCGGILLTSLGKRTVSILQREGRALGKIFRKLSGEDAFQTSTRISMGAKAKEVSSAVILGKGDCSENCFLDLFNVPINKTAWMADLWHEESVQGHWNSRFIWWEGPSMYRRWPSTSLLSSASHHLTDLSFWKKHKRK